MRLLRWCIGGSIGGAIGGAIWIAVSYGINWEVGYIAIGVGWLVGLGVRFTAGEDDGVLPGTTAVLISIASILLAKYIVVALAVSSAVAEIEMPKASDPDVMIGVFAAGIAYELESSGKEVKWPKNRRPEGLLNEKNCPPEIWETAQGMWNNLSPEQKQMAIEACEKEQAESIEEWEAQVRSEGFFESLSPWDGLWFFLAAGTAYKMGAGTMEQE